MSDFLRKLVALVKNMQMVLAVILAVTMLASTVLLLIAMFKYLGDSWLRDFLFFSKFVFFPILFAMIVAGLASWCIIGPFIWLLERAEAFCNNRIPAKEESGEELICDKNGTQPENSDKNGD